MSQNLHHNFVNELVILTFGAKRSMLPDDDTVFDFIRATTIMYKRILVINKDVELDHLAAQETTLAAQSFTSR